ncbi:MAG: O-antigen ligase family protein [Phototrophicaceae bacterium]
MRIIRTVGQLQLALLLILAGLWIRPFSIWGLPSTWYAVRFIHLIPLAIALICTTLTWRSNAPITKSARFWWFSITALTLWSLASQGWAFLNHFPPSSPNYHPEIAANSAFQGVLMLGWVWAVAVLKPPIRWMVAALLLALALHSIITVIQAWQQHSIGLSGLGEFNTYPDKDGASVLTATGIRWLRPYGFLPHPNHLGGVLTVCLLACGGWLLGEQRVGLAVMLAPVGLYALLLTFSRAAWLGFAVGAILFVVLSWRTLWRQWRRVIITLVAMVSTSILFIAGYWPLIVERAAPITGIALQEEAIQSGQTQSTEARSVSDRRVYTALTWGIIRDFPLRGVGAGNLPWKISQRLIRTSYDLRGNYVHNIYLAAWGDLGIVGLTLYGASIFGGIGLGIWRHHQQPNPLNAALIAGACAWAVVGLFDYYPYTLLPLQLLWWGLIVLPILEPSSAAGASATDHTPPPLPLH